MEGNRNATLGHRSMKAHGDLIRWRMQGAEQGGKGHKIVSNEGLSGREKPQTHGSHKLSSMLGTIADPHFLYPCKYQGKYKSRMVVQGEITEASLDKLRTLDFTPQA